MFPETPQQLIDSNLSLSENDIPFLELLFKYAQSVSEKTALLNDYLILKKPDAEQIDRNDALIRIKNQLDGRLNHIELDRINAFFFGEGNKLTFTDDNGLRRPIFRSRYDIFLSFSEEDVDTACQLYNELIEKELIVWFSREDLKSGDSIFRVINEAIRRSRYGVVLLSRYTFEDQFHFPMLELEALINRKLYSSLKGIFPIYHNISHVEIVDYSPLIAGFMAVDTQSGLETIAENIRKIIKSGDS